MKTVSVARDLMARRQFDLALDQWRSVLADNPDIVVALVGSGDCLMALKQFVSAVEVYARAQALKPEVPDLLFALGTAEVAAGLPERARDHLQQYLEHDDTNPHAHNNLAMAFERLGDRDAAASHFQRALELKPDLKAASGALKSVRQPRPDWQAVFDGGVKKIHTGDFVGARDHFQSVLLARPNDHMAWESLGVSELGLGRSAKALKALDEALKLEPRALGALHHRAIALRAMGRLDDSVQACDQLLEVDPGNGYARSVRGAIFLEAGRIPAAIVDLEAAVGADVGNNRPALQGALAYACRALCQWDEKYEKARSEVVKSLSDAAAPPALMVISPFQVLPLGLDGGAQAEVARRASIKAASSIGSLPKTNKPLRQDMRLRIGYLSPDFSNHSVATALRDVIACHDRARFVVEAFSLGRTRDEMTDQLQHDFDAFHEIVGLGHGQAAAFIAHRDIDILIDLAGHTKGARPEILAYKAAPVQVSAIGYGAPVSAGFVPWHLVDRHLVPQDARRYYSENLVDMPDCAIPASRPVRVADGVDRRSAGLPETGVVLANFGGSYKIDPFTFDAWMRILTQVPDACLALLDNTALVNDRLRAEAEARGVSGARLVFVPFIDRALHLARYAHVDLCLDTLTHNGGVTTTDALWLGAPVLTMRRDDLPDRMGPSLLNAAGLPELVAGDVDGFVQTAARIAGNSAFLSTLRQKVFHNQKTAPLFDTALYTKNLETVLLDLWAKAVDNPFSNER